MSSATGLTEYAVLFSEKEFKKTSMEYFYMRDKSKTLFDSARRIIPGGGQQPGEGL